MSPLTAGVEAPDGEPLDGGGQQQHEERHRHGQRAAQPQAGRATATAPPASSPRRAARPQAPRYTIRPRIDELGEQRERHHQQSDRQGGQADDQDPVAAGARARLLGQCRLGRRRWRRRTAGTPPARRAAPGRRRPAWCGGSPMDDGHGRADHRAASGQISRNGQKPQRIGDGLAAKSPARIPSLDRGDLARPPCSRRFGVGAAAAHHAGLQEVERQLVGQAPVLRLAGEGVDRQLERLARAARRRGRIAHVARTCSR